MSTSMRAPESRAMTLGSRHCHAICAEIGERLAIALQPPTELPPRLVDLLARLAQLDHDAPSIVPDIEDMMPEAA